MKRKKYHINRHRISWTLEEFLAKKWHQMSFVHKLCAKLSVYRNKHRLS